MESHSRITICDGDVVTFADRFESRPGVFGKAHSACGPFEVSASRNAVCVHKADLHSDEAVERFIEAVRAAQAQARKLVGENRWGSYRRAQTVGAEPNHD